MGDVLVATGGILVTLLLLVVIVVRLRNRRSRRRPTYRHISRPYGRSGGSRLRDMLDSIGDSFDGFGGGHGHGGGGFDGGGGGHGGD